MKTIRLFATVRDMAAGAKHLSVPLEDGATVRDMIRAISALHPQIGAQLLDENGQLSTVIHIYVRGRNVEWLQGLKTAISAQDDVFLVPPMAGG